MSGPTDSAHRRDVPHWRLAKTEAAARPLVVGQLPRTLYIETSNRCNSLCQTCPLTFFGSQGGAHDLSLEDFRRVVDQVPDLERVVLHGIGEPLLNRHLPAMIRHLKGRGVHTLFNSNAILLTRKWRDLLLDSGLDEFRASLDAATPETYLAIRGVPLHARVVRNLADFAAARRARGGGPKVSVWFTVMRENIEELPAVARLVATIGADEFYVQRLVYFDRGLATAEQSLYRHLTALETGLIDEAEALCRVAGVGFAASGGNDPQGSFDGPHGERPWMSCNRPWYLSYVTAHGDVLPCCFAPFITNDLAPVTLGNALQAPLAAIWNGPAYQDFRRRFQTDDPRSICANCGVKWSV